MERKSVIGAEQRQSETKTCKIPLCFRKTGVVLEIVFLRQIRSWCFVGNQVRASLSKSSRKSFTRHPLGDYYFPFFIPPPFIPPPFIFEEPGFGDKKRFLFLLKSLTVFFLGASVFGFFGSIGCSFGVGSFFSSDMTGCFIVFCNGAKLEKDGCHSVVKIDPIFYPQRLVPWFSLK